MRDRAEPSNRPARRAVRCCFVRARQLRLWLFKRDNDSEGGTAVRGARRSRGGHGGRPGVAVVRFARAFHAALAVARAGCAGDVLVQHARARFARARAHVRGRRSCATGRRAGGPRRARRRARSPAHARADRRGGFREDHRARGARVAPSLGVRRGDVRDVVRRRGARPPPRPRRCARRRLAALADSLARRPSVRPRALLRGPELLPGRRPLPGEVLPRAQAHIPHPRARALGPREPSPRVRRVPRTRRHVPPRPRRRRRRGERARRALRLLRRRRRRRRRSARTNRARRERRNSRGPSRARRVAAPIPSARRSVHPRRARRYRVCGRSWRRPMPRCFENRRRLGGVARARVDDGIRDAPVDDFANRADPRRRVARARRRRGGEKSRRARSWASPRGGDGGGDSRQVRDAGVRARRRAVRGGGDIANETLGVGRRRRRRGGGVPRRGGGGDARTPQIGGAGAREPVERAGRCGGARVRRRGGEVRRRRDERRRDVSRVRAIRAHARRTQSGGDATRARATRPRGTTHQSATRRRGGGFGVRGGFGFRGSLGLGFGFRGSLGSRVKVRARSRVARRRFRRALRDVSTVARAVVFARRVGARDGTLRRGRGRRRPDASENAIASSRARVGGARKRRRSNSVYVSRRVRARGGFGTIRAPERGGSHRRRECSTTSPRGPRRAFPTPSRLPTPEPPSFRRRVFATLATTNSRGRVARRRRG